MTHLDEAQLERATVDYVRELGYEYVHGAHSAPDGEAPERDNYGQVVLVGRLRVVIFCINAYMPTEVTEAVRKVECLCC